MLTRGLNVEASLGRKIQHAYLTGNVVDVAALFGQVRPEVVMAALPDDVVAAQTKSWFTRVRRAPTAVPSSSSYRVAGLLRACGAAASRGSALVGLSYTGPEAVGLDPSPLDHVRK